MNSNQKYEFFWNGPFSQWYPSEFETEGLKFKCCEQYMMYRKSIIFGDSEMADLIMQSKDPKVQKMLGRRVKNFDEKIWGEKNFQIVYKGNYEKFTQNPKLKETLLATGDKILVEASPYDRIWGIGLREDNELIKDPKNWRGQNLLGWVLTLLKHELR
jgi:ribA/ribD-fused uncharacterized protein